MQKFITLPRSIVMSVSVCVLVCVSVCLSATTSLELHVRSSPNCLHMLPMAVARSSSGSVVMRYVLPVLWMTSCLLISQGCLTLPPQLKRSAHAALGLAINCTAAVIPVAGQTTHGTISRSRIRWQHRGWSLQSVTVLLLIVTVKMLIPIVWCGY